MLLSGLASLFNYATYPLLARALSDLDFVNITVALSLLTQMSSFSSSIVALSIGLSKQTDSESTRIIEKLQAVLMQMFLGIIIIFFIISPLLLNSIKLSAVFLLPICLLLLFSIPISIISGFLSGRHKLIKLAFVALISAILQFALTITIGFTTKNGPQALSAMAAGQFLAIFVLYWLYKKDKLPHLSTVFKYKLASFRTPEMKSLIRFTILSSVGIMAINILQVIDLFVIQNRQTDARLYTDLYIISRVVFFAGTIFIWPFLSYIDIYTKAHNVVVFVKLVGILSLVSIGAIVGILLFGQTITQVLFGTTYPADTINHVGILAITYKYLFLLLTALTLFFIVIRSYWAITLPAILTLATAIYISLLDRSASTLEILYGLNAIAGVGLMVGLGFFFVSIKTTKSKVNQAVKVTNG